MANAILIPGKEKRVYGGHPWVFRSDIARVEGDFTPGDIVSVYSSKGKFLAKAFYNPQSQISLRIMSLHDEPIDRAFIFRRVKEAVDYRRTFADLRSCRLIFAESDRLPALIVDSFGDVLVLQCLALGMERFKQDVVDALVEEVHPQGIYERSDVPVRRLEGLEQLTGVMYGTVPDRVEMVENGVHFWVDVKEGQKTGFFLDQRCNRELVERYAAGRTVLNTFCYTGGFSVYAAAGGAKEVCSVDASERAVQLADENMRLNFGDSFPHTTLACDAVEYLKQIGDRYDLIILDPPAFAKHHKVLGNAMQGYKRLNARALSQIRPGGILFTFSCSQAVTKELFRTTVFSAAAIAGRNVRILHQLAQPADHPINIYHPEGEYLKGLVLYVE